MRDAGQRLMTAAGKAKTPLIATGAAAGGLAGGAALARGSKAPKRALDTVMPNGVSRRFGPKPGTAVKLLGTAAKEAGKAGFRIGELTTEVRKVREQMNSN